MLQSINYKGKNKNERLCLCNVNVSVMIIRGVSLWTTGVHQEYECSSPDIRPWQTSRTNQDFTFRDHFFSPWLEKCVSKEFGLAAHNEELRCFLQSRKLVGRLCFFSTVEDCSVFLEETLMEETCSEWSLHSCQKTKRIFKKCSFIFSQSEASGAVIAVKC